MQLKTTHTQVPVASGRGESGRESVGDGVPTAKLLLLLLRELWEEENKYQRENIWLRNAITSTITQHMEQSFISAVNSHAKWTTVNLWTWAVDCDKENTDSYYDTGVYTKTYMHGYKHVCT